MAGNSNNRIRTEQKRSRGKYQVANIGKAIANQLTLLQNLILWHFKSDVKGRYSKTPKIFHKKQNRIQSMSNEGRYNRRCYSCLFFGHIARNCPRINKGRADRDFIETGFWRDAQVKNEGQPQRVNQETNWRGSRLGQNIQRKSNTQEISVALEQRPQVCRTSSNKSQQQKSHTMKNETDHRSKATDSHHNKQESSVKELGKEDDGSKLQVIATQNNQVTSKEVKTEADDDSEKVKENNRELLKVNKKVKANLIKTGQELAARKMEEIKGKYEHQLKGMTEEIIRLNEKIKSLAHGKQNELNKLQTILKITQDQIDTAVEAEKFRNKQLMDENARLTHMMDNLKDKLRKEENETAKLNQKINQEENIDNKKYKEIQIKLKDQTKELNKIKADNEKMRQRLDDSIEQSKYLEKRNKILEINIEALTIEKGSLQQQALIRPDTETQHIHPKKITNKEENTSDEEEVSEMGFLATIRLAENQDNQGKDQSISASQTHSKDETQIRQQQGESLQQYSERVAEFCTQAHPKLGEKKLDKQMKKYFINGLPSTQLQDDMRKTRLKTFQQVVRTAKNYCGFWIYKNDLWE